MEWIYKNKKYASYKVNFDEVKFTIDENIVVYHPKWDKCFTLQGLGFHGNGNQLKANITDIYTNKYCWVCAKDLELVKEI